MYTHDKGPSFRESRRMVDHGGSGSHGGLSPLRKTC